VSMIPDEEWARRKPRQAPMGLPYVDDLAEVDELLDVQEAEADDEVIFNSPDPDPDLLEMGKFTAGGDAVMEMSKLTGLKPQFIESLTYRNLVRKRVVNQTRKGKIPSQYVLTVVGNENGLAGYGEGKSTYGDLAKQQAFLHALTNLAPIPRYENRTIYGTLQAKFHAVHLTLRSRPPGYGLRVNHNIHEVCKCIGIADISGKVIGSTNPINVVKCTFEALLHQSLPREISRARGKQVIDIRRAYFEGLKA